MSSLKDQKNTHKDHNKSDESSKHEEYLENWEGLDEVPVDSGRNNINNNTQHADRYYPRWEVAAEIAKTIPNSQRALVVIVGMMLCAVSYLATIDAALVAYLFVTVPTSIFVLLIVILKYFEYKNHPP